MLFTVVIHFDLIYCIWFDLIWLDLILELGVASFRRRSWRPVTTKWRRILLFHLVYYGVLRILLHSANHLISFNLIYIWNQV